MLTGKHVAFIGGDARQLEVVKRCIQLDASVTLIGFDNLESIFTGATKRPLTCDVLKDVDALILPIVGSDDHGYVESIFCSNPPQLLEEHVASLPKHCVVYTGMAKSYLVKLLSAQKIELMELLDRDDVAIYNSIPTVEGALMMAIQHTDITIHGSNSIVLGLGRTGMSMARALHSLGAKVRVGARRQEHLARIFEMGLQPFHMSELKQQVFNADFVFNTVPQLVLTAEVIAQMPQTAFILDLASKPGGTDFRYAERRGIKALLAPGLPGIVAPKTAGQILAHTLSRLIGEQSKTRGNQHE
ncbi:dipicolinate synthase subunit DpsA [Brevibacillus ruminantium]|uniref:Dipicolinate synthase subunit DpsA n=1 Tax=Brevibacillus ruminantium TaxID=2950604 RepID=A0ABY4WPH8_9BACL|nr:dipicolinate synthase subunit DpsA [Brevibacillus ruminantium]USG67982.1 dipicolinate synthase subunit DpsA [Brevibacillus ruminantium]